MEEKAGRTPRMQGTAGLGDEGTGKNWRTTGAWWAAEEWQCKEEGRGEGSTKERTEPEVYGLWMKDLQGDGGKQREGGGRVAS